MKLLFVTATYLEIKPFISHLRSNSTNFFEKSLIPNAKAYDNHPFLYSCKYHQNFIDILITGAGMLQSCYFLSEMTNKKFYTFITNVGIAGSFDKNIHIGDLLNVFEQEIGDLGVENEENNFLPLHQMPFFDGNQFPYKNGVLYNKCRMPFSCLKLLPKVKAISVNRITSSALNVAQMRDLFSASVENMEGAAVFYVCLMKNIPFCEIRAISNYVGVRDKSKWNIPLAVANLNNKLVEMAEELGNG